MEIIEAQYGKKAVKIILNVETSKKNSRDGVVRESSV